MQALRAKVESFMGLMNGALDDLVDAIAEAVVAKMGERKGPAVEPKLLSIKQAAPYLARTEAALRAMIASGELPEAVIKRVGSRVFLVKRTLDDWVNAQ